MTYRESCILLPCHSLEDFPLHYEGDDAAGLLAAWTALWHPALLAADRQPDPNGGAAIVLPARSTGRLILAPGVSLHEIPTDFAERATTEGAVFIQGNLPREEILRQALAPLRAPGRLAGRGRGRGFSGPRVTATCRSNCSRGKCGTRRTSMKRGFSSRWWREPRRPSAGNTTEAKDQLVACFDLLAQERDHYYAVDAYMLDVTLRGIPHDWRIAGRSSWPPPFRSTSS